MEGEEPAPPGDAPEGGTQEGAEPAPTEPKPETDGVKDEKENIPVETAAEASDDNPRASEVDNVTDKSRESDKVVEIGTSEFENNDKTDKRSKKKRKKHHKKKCAKEGDVSPEVPAEGETKVEKPKEGEEAKDEKAEEKPPPKPVEEVYEDKGCFIVSEYWCEPDYYVSHDDENMERLQVGRI